MPSLAYPAEEASHEAVAQSPAVRLFIERATEVLPSFELTARNAPAVADVCRRLDGVPLALELAAARVPVLSPRQIAAHLGNRFELLKAGRRVVPSRQQTLRAAIDWSHDLLSEPERRLLRRLAVFADGWDLEAVEAVCGAPDLEAGALVDVLGQLVEKSLVVAGPRDDEMRYRLLETVREYAWERLTQAGEADALRDRHRDWCLGLVERVPPEWLDPAQVDLLDAVQDELRAALRWSIERGTVEVGLGLAIGCWPMWYLRGRFAEGRTWLLALAHLATTTDVEVLRGRALAFAGHLAFCEGDTAGAETLLRDGLALAERSGDRVGSCVCSLYLGHVVGLRSTRAESEKLYDRALALARGEGSWAWQTRVLMVLARVNYEQGNTPRATTFAAEALELFAVRDHPTSRARVMALNGRLAASTGDHTAARALAEQSVALLDRLGDKQGQAYAHGLAAQSALDRGDRRDAARHLEAVLVLTRETRERMAVARGLEGMVELLAGTDPARAARLAGVAAGVRETARLAAAPVEHERLERALVRLRSALGRAAAAALQADGRARATGASIADLAEEVATAAAAARLVAASEPLAPAAVADARAGHGLTRREQEVAVLVARGLDSRHIATELVIAEGTVRIHVEHILAKLELHSRSQLAVWVLEHGLLRSSS
ncbi:MAG: hypothetical protein JOY61_16175 [Chloroflexi bacterium]|nr:hypothetical protein [Chloroflexota bacterium]